MFRHFPNITLLSNHVNSLCHVAEMFDLAGWHQMASSTFRVMAFDCNDSGQSKGTTWNELKAIWYQATKSNISAT